MIIGHMIRCFAGWRPFTALITRCTVVRFVSVRRTGGRDPSMPPGNVSVTAIRVTLAGTRLLATAVAATPRAKASVTTTISNRRINQG